MEYSFEGTVIEVIGPRNHTFSAFNIYIDNSDDPELIELFKNKDGEQIPNLDLKQENLYSNKSLSDENVQHTIKLEVISVDGQRTKAEFDAFKVYSMQEGNIDKSILQDKLEEFDSIDTRKFSKELK